jgi:hypothetical protein
MAQSPVGVEREWLVHTCGSRKPVATVTRPIGTHVITPLAAHSGDATHRPPGPP